MREKNQKFLTEESEAEAVLAFELLLINVLLLTIIAAFAWMAHFVLTENNSLYAILRGGVLR